MGSNLQLSPFMDEVFGVKSKNSLPAIDLEDLEGSLTFPPHKCCIAVSFTFKCMIHFELIFI